MYKTSISLINNCNEQYIRSLQLDAIEAIANKTIIDERVCSIQSLFYGLDCNFTIVDNINFFLDYLEPIIDIANSIKSNLVFGAPKLRYYTKENESKFIYFLNSIDSMCDGAIFSIEPNAEIYGGSNLFRVDETIKFFYKFNCFVYSK